MALVAHARRGHRAPSIEPASCEPARLAWGAATSLQPHVHVDHDLVNTPCYRRVYAFRRVDRQGDPGSVGHERSQSVRVHQLVREQQVLTEASCDHAFAFADRGAREASVARPSLQLGDLRALVRLDVRSKAVAGKRPCHLRDVEIEAFGVDHEGRGR